MTEPDNKIFVCGNAHLDRLLSDPEIAAGVAEAHAAAEEMDRTYAMNLAMIRKAGQMTQVEVAKKLGVGQGVVSRLENRDDMLLSTLFDHLMATGAEAAVRTGRARGIGDLGGLADVVVAVTSDGSTGRHGGGEERPTSDTGPAPLPAQRDGRLRTGPG